MESDIVGDTVTMDLVEVLEMGTSLSGPVYDGACHRSNLPTEAYQTNYFTLRDAATASLIGMTSEPASY